ncbi:MAG: transcriptional regulator, partial [Anaerolineae bacterium]|nr:transcriptional regulator [Anaerolineae bacterium]
MSDFGDISKRFKKARASEDDAQEDRLFDYEESYRLRAKMLGVLIRDARASAARTVQECARLLGVSVETFESWEFGDDVPSLPQLELLAYYLGVHISHFWGVNTLEGARIERIDTQTQYTELRDRMIGALLQQAREEQSLSQEDVADHSGIPLEVIQQYELGEVSIPMHHLPTLANIVNRNPDYFLETSGYVGTLLKIYEEWKRFTDLDPDIRAFAANPSNVAFIKIAMT